MHEKLFEVLKINPYFGQKHPKPVLNLLQINYSYAFDNSFVKIRSYGSYMIKKLLRYYESVKVHFRTQSTLSAGLEFQG